MRAFDKYISCEFGYMTDSGLMYLVYTGSEKQEFTGEKCFRCGKELHNKIAHTFNDEDGAEWRFGNECVKHVIGVGLGK